MMKNILRVTLFAVGVLWAFGATGNAQVSQQYAANVPFDFSVGNKLMKAGDYRILPAAGVSNQRMLILTNRNTGKAVVAGQATLGSSLSDEGGKLVFGKYGDQWVLQAINTSRFELKLRGKRSNDIKVAEAVKAAETRTVAIKN
jgi:hypothetical protein